ncbi:potassium channel family protein [Pararhizobium antarcticum]|uniref:Ion transporter n=1 Tax=Pararhizobium antarcticum TaxID=1798805 RepID=A0A657LW96_9HYPH|nr:potassium channel family protein [Pararhizobium antarcticum]OJF96442.1 ion transporter [Pararhizobium antarcticum]OJF97981.1 ion transporter [Rhizobium sp. 58]
MDSTTDHTLERKTAFKRLRRRLRSLYFGSHPVAIRFQIAMALLDIAIIGFFIASPHLGRGNVFLVIDYGIALLIAFELAARAIIAPNLRYWAARGMTWVDLIILATLLFPTLLSSFAFLRFLRIWVLGQSKLLKLLLLRAGYGRIEDVVQACVNLLTFLFLVTGFVYTTFYGREPKITNFIDALYFTVATVTTTGFGDVTLPGTLGKITSIITMIFGISLFVRLAQAVVRPYKVVHPCPQCALQRHDTDAVHCKACGHILNIPDDGD